MAKIFCMLLHSSSSISIFLFFASNSESWTSACANNFDLFLIINSAIKSINKVIWILIKNDQYVNAILFFSRSAPFRSISLSIWRGSAFTSIIVFQYGLQRVIYDRVIIKKIKDKILSLTICPKSQMKRNLQDKFFSAIFFFVLFNIKIYEIFFVDSFFVVCISKKREEDHGWHSPIIFKLESSFFKFKVNKGISLSRCSALLLLVLLSLTYATRITQSETL